MSAKREKKEGHDNPQIAATMAAKLGQGAEDLKAILSIDEAAFRIIAPQAQSCSRDYFVFEALDELQKVVVGALQALELLSGEEADPTEPLTRIVAESVDDVCALWQRKLIETLADLIGLGETSGELYFRDFLLHAQLDAQLAAQKDMNKYYGSESLNVASQVTELATAISTLETGGLDPNDAWYRRRQGPFDMKRAKPGHLFASFGTRFEHALQLASDGEKGALGFSYGAGFGRASAGLHARPGPIDVAASLEGAHSSINAALTIGLSVLIRCQKILGSVPDGPNSWLRSVVDNNVGPTRILTTLRGKAEVGNIVMAYDYLAQVLEVAEGLCGYQSYRVRYLSEPPLAEIPEDWHPAQHVRLVLNASLMRKMLKAEAEKRQDQDVEKMLSLDDVRLQDVFAQSVATVESHGGELRKAIIAQATKTSGEKEQGSE